jgi:hypothetical protein
VAGTADSPQGALHGPDELEAVGALDGVGELEGDRLRPVGEPDRHLGLALEPPGHTEEVRVLGLGLIDIVDDDAGVVQVDVVHEWCHQGESSWM